ncbi:hypothetical protein B0T21DRAFT_87540 [Apiosordaria backusii]|uniref:Secreted protein n=1 Tax=Apiosordaria backusii TaxID=314023 RepID=A0AA40ERW3_9PEZI|nr:hypothetical protein B0T21DRAFT_87540 [Apiosordaria backusii]
MMPFCLSVCLFVRCCCLLSRLAHTAERGGCLFVHILGFFFFFPCFQHRYYIYGGLQFFRMVFGWGRKVWVQGRGSLYYISFFSHEALFFSASAHVMPAKEARGDRKQYIIIGEKESGCC